MDLGRKLAAQSSGSGERGDRQNVEKEVLVWPPCKRQRESCRQGAAGPQGSRERARALVGGKFGAMLSSPLSEPLPTACTHERAFDHHRRATPDSSWHRRRERSRIDTHICTYRHTMHR